MVKRMRLKAILCQVFTREMEYAAARSPHSVDLEILTMGLHDLGVAMRSQLQERIDANDQAGYDAILLGYALCGRGTEGLHAGTTQLVLPRAHDCIGVLMGGRQRYQEYFQNHPGVYYRSPGWIEFQKGSQWLGPAGISAKKPLGERRSLAELIAQYGEENGWFLFDQFTAYRRKYSGLTYITTGLEADGAFREQARAEAEKEHWAFEEYPGSIRLLEGLVNGDWNAGDFLVVPPGLSVAATFDADIVRAR